MFVVCQLFEGYVVGFNCFFCEVDGKIISCFGQFWLWVIVIDDLLCLIWCLLVEGGVGQFVDVLVVVVLFGMEKVVLSGEQVFQVVEQWCQCFCLECGSNVIVVGSECLVDGKGMFLVNLYFFWNGVMCFYQMYLIIFGWFDVMGVLLFGLLVVNIGFSCYLVWIYMVDIFSYFILYCLVLDLKDLWCYLVDGCLLLLEEKFVVIEVCGVDGKLLCVEYKVYQLIYGLLVVWFGKLDWNCSEVYVLCDVNLENIWVLQQWYLINQVSDVVDLCWCVEVLQGIFWVNILVVDEQGNVLYMNQLVVFYLKLELIFVCVIL